MEPENSTGLSDQELGDRTGMGLPEEALAPEEGSEEETGNEAAETAAGAGESQGDAGKERGKESKETAASSSKEEPEEGDEEDDDGDEEDAPHQRTGRQRTVPYSKLKSERAKRTQFEGEMRTALSEVQSALASIRSEKSGKTEEQELGAIESEAEKLSEELGLDAPGLAKVLKTAVQLAKKELGGQIPKELKDKLEVIETLQSKSAKDDEERADQAEVDHFNGEWDSLVPSLRKQFPNATDSMLEEAKKVMDETAHSKKYHSYDLDYVLFKEGQKFETLLKVAPGKKSGETAKSVGTAAEDVGSEDDNDSEVDLEDMTPDIMRNREQRQISTKRDSRKDYTIINPVQGRG